jgi:hypothetical protein
MLSARQAEETARSKKSENDFEPLMSANLR